MFGGLTYTAGLGKTQNFELRIVWLTYMSDRLAYNISDRLANFESQCQVK